MSIRNLLRGALAFAFALSCIGANAQSSVGVHGVISVQNTNATGVCSDPNACLEIDVVDKGAVTVQVGGTYTGALTGQVTTDGVTWITLAPTPFAPAGALGTPTATISSGSTGAWQISAAAGWRKFRVTGLGAMTGSAVVSMQTSAASLGGGGSSGGGGASTIADGADVNAGTTTDAAASVGGTGTLSAKQRLMTTQLGGVTETAPASDTASSGLNGRLQRIAQNLSTLDGHVTASNSQLPSALGQTTASGSLSVVQASDATPVVAQGSTTSGQKISLAGCATTTSAPTNTTAQSNALNCDTFGNVRVIQPDGVAIASVSCSAACNGTTLLSADMTGYESVTWQVTAAGSGTITFQTSEDNSTWVSLGCYNASLLGGSTTVVATTTTAALFKCPKGGRYARAQFTAYSSGTFTAQGSLHKSPAPGIVTSAYVGNTLAAQGTNTQGGAISASPMVGGIEARTAAPTAVSSAQAARTIGTVEGIPVLRPYTIPEREWNYAAATSGIVNTTTAVTIKAAASGSDRNYITGIDLTCEALGTATEVAIRDGAGGTVLWRTKVGTGGLTSGFSRRFDDPLRGSTATLLEVVTLTASGTGACYFNATGFVAP